MWHVSSRSGVATLRTAIHLLLTYLLLPFSLPFPSSPLPPLEVGPLNANCYTLVTYLLTRTNNVEFTSTDRHAYTYRERVEIPVHCSLSPVYPSRQRQLQLVFEICGRTDMPQPAIGHYDAVSVFHESALTDALLRLFGTHCRKLPLIVALLLCLSLF